MCEILISNTTFMIAIAIFVLCILIGFFGDMHMRKSGKTGSFLKKQKPQEDNESENSDSLDESTASNTQTSSTDADGLIDFDSQAIFNNGSVQSGNPGAISNTTMQNNQMPETVSQVPNAASNQFMNQTQIQNGMQFQNNGAIQGQYYNAAPMGTNMTQNNPNFGNPNQIQNVMQNQMVQNQGLEQEVNQVQNFPSQQNMNNFQNNTPSFNNNQAVTNAQAGYNGQVLNNNPQNINNPVPFDGNLQNDDQINNMF